jgi:hypothetical protein
MWRRRRSPVWAATAFGLGLALGVVTGRGDAQSAPPVAGNPLPAGPNRELVVGACVICHSLETMAQQRLDRATWGDIVARMITYGAPITSDTRPLILEYLVTYLGPGETAR